jgi:cyanophycin synthetase
MAIILLLILLLCNDTYKKENLINFDSSDFYKYYDKHNITINGRNNTLTKNGSVINYTNHFNSPNARRIADDKVLTKNILIKHNIPTPKFHFWVSNKSDIYNINKLKKLKFPVVVKPIDGTYGYNVVVDIKTMDKAVVTIKEQVSNGHKVMIEEMVRGDIFRILVFAGKVIDIYKKEPGYVIGNGISTVNELINQQNHEKKIINGIPVRDIEWDYIKYQGYEKQSVIPINTKVEVTHAANVNNGAVVTPIKLSDVHPANLDMFIKINKICNLNLNGIDFITHSLSIPYTRDGSVIENNARPGVQGHQLMNPDSMDEFIKLIRFKPRRVAKKINY